MPDHWRIERGKSLFVPSSLPVLKSDEIVTCFRDGQVTLRSNRRSNGFMIALKEIGYQGVRRGQLVIHAMDAFAGAVGVSDSDGKCSPEYIVCNPRSKGSEPRYYALLLRLAAQQRYIEVACQAVRERAPRLRYPNFGEMLLPVPPADEQAAIVKYLGHVDRKISRYIRTKKRLIEVLAEEREVATVRAAQDGPAPRARLETITRVMSRPVDRAAHEMYTAIGLFNRGRGIFHKEPRKGADLGDSTFFWVKPGDLVISGQFAWEGSIAMAGEDDAGCIASHRYPILQGKEQVVLTSYLLAFLRTREGQQLLDHHSRGGAGRNRPLNLRTLLKEKMPIPSMVDQRRVGLMLAFEHKVAMNVGKTFEALREWRARFVADVVTGKLDVREPAAKLSDVTDEDVVLNELEDVLQDDATAEELEAEDEAA